MSLATNLVSSAAAYKEFENQLRPALRGLSIPISSIVAQVKQTVLTANNPPGESYVVEVKFPGAKVDFDFGRSSREPSFFGCIVKLHRTSHPTLSLSDYIVFPKLGTVDSLRFRLHDVSLLDGVSCVVNMIISVFGTRLRKVLEGHEWETAPFDWGDYK